MSRFPDLTLDNVIEIENRVWLLREQRGKAARRMTPKLLRIANDLRALSVDKIDAIEEGSDLSPVLNVFERLWEPDEFEDEVLPFVLQVADARAFFLDDRERDAEPLGAKWLDTHGKLDEVLNAFMVAISCTLAGAASPEVEEAVKKSQPGQSGLEDPKPDLESDT